MSVRSKPNREDEAPAALERDGSELPEGWANTTVAAVIADCQPGFASGDKNVEDGVLHLRMNNIGLLGELILDLVRTVPEKLAKSQHELQLGDVLVCTTNSAKLVGKCAIFDLEGRYAFSNHLTRLRPNRDAIDSSYLRWCLWSLWKAGAFDDKCKHWVNQSTIPKDALLDADIPLPPLAEQRRIVGKLELLLGKVSSSQQRLSRVPGLLKRFRQSVLAAACSGKLTADWREENENSPVDSRAEVDIPADFPTLPESWCWTTLESVCLNVVDCPHSTPKWTDAGKLCIRTTNFRPGILDLSEVRFVSPATFDERIERLRPEPGDIVYSREGGILGIACQIPPGVELCLGQRMMLFRVRAEYAATLLMHWLNSPVITHRVQELTGGSASPHLNVRDIRAFPTPIPPLTEQQEIVRRVEKLFAFADQIEVRLKQAQAHVDRLTQSLLAKAFRGELVPTEHALATAAGRDYEPASALLERIRSNGTVGKPAKRPQRAKQNKTPLQT